MKRSLPILIALILCVVLCSCKSKDATAADDMILAIGEVTLDSEQDIIQAENAVNALEDKDYKQLEERPGRPLKSSRMQFGRRRQYEQKK